MEVLRRNDLAHDAIEIVKVDSAEADEMWSFVQNKGNQRWLWHAISHETGEVLAYVIGESRRGLIGVDGASKAVWDRALFY